MTKTTWKREDVAAKLAAYEKERQTNGTSQRQLVEELGVPQSTLQHWLKRKDNIDADPKVVAFFESPEGIAFLHRLVLGAHFVMTLLGACGVRLVCTYLEISGLSQFVASSYGAQRKIAVSMEQSTVKFGETEEERLSTEMKPKQITVAEDETFHPQTCLVAIEPVSNYIILEQYTEDRKGDTWTEAMTEAIGDKPITVIQSTSDEGTGICSHVKNGLGAHHSPDLFHVQQEIIKGTSGPLASKKRQAEETLIKSQKELKKRQKEQRSQSKKDECVLERLQTAQETEREAKAAFEICQNQQQRVRDANRAISTIYHPYALDTGLPQSAESMSDLLDEQFTVIKSVAQEADLSERSHKRISKAKRVVVHMVATIAFFWLTVQAKIEGLELSSTVERAVYDNLIPAIYLQFAADKTDNPVQRDELRQKSDSLLAPLIASNGPFRGLEETEKQTLEDTAKECAALFQRSSSCVEGRNGQLSLRHHSFHRLSDRKLNALTTVHNFYLKRDDGTTAAERFFGVKPKDLFEWLLSQIDLPGYPAKKRSKPKPKGYLLLGGT